MFTFPRRVRWTFVPLFWLVVTTGVGAFHCFAQNAGVAEVSGVVRDTSGAAIPGAEVKITQIGTKLERQITTDAQGRYVAPALPVGSYQLEVSVAGFKTYVQSNILLQVGNNIDIDVSMEVGNTSERLDVTAQASMVETRDTTTSQVIDELRINDLPLDGRQPTELIYLAGASVSAANSQFTGSRNLYSSVSISVAGGAMNGVNYMLDGADNNDAQSNVNLSFPFPDALQEFSVQTGSLPARFGLHPGGVVNAVTKSGTNDWHGDLFEYLRNGDVDARNFFAPTPDTLKRNQFGGTFGDRIIRDKLFFFAGFQGTFNRQNPPESVSFVPTPAVLQGNFNVIDGPGCVAGGKSITLMNPYTGAPFPNNQIPVSLFDPASVALTKFLPAAQNSCGRATYGIPSTGDDDQGIIRVDWVQSTKNTVYGRVFVDNYRNPDVYNGMNILQTDNAGNLQQSTSATLGDTYIFSPTLLNSAHLTFTRAANSRGPAGNAINASSLGINVYDPAPNILYSTVSGYFTAGCNACADAFFDNNSWSFSDDVDIVRGKHQMAFGVLIMRNQFNAVNDVQLNGSFGFTGQYASNASVNDALAAFMLGTMSNYTQSQPQVNATRETIVAPYAQDSIRVNSRLTVNVGLRWEPALIPYDASNKGATFSQAAFNAGQRSTVFTNAPAGLLFYGDPGVSRSFQKNDLGLFSPRLGIAWDPTGSGRQTIRVAGAILRDTLSTFYVNKETANPPFGTAVSVPFPLAEGGTFSNPWAGYPGGDPFPQPSPLPKNFVFPTQASYYLLQPNYKSPYMAQWSVSYQRQITQNWLASATYIGNKSTNILSSEDENPSQYIPGSKASTNQRRLLYLQNPTLGAAYGLMELEQSNGNSNYNAVLLSVQHRFAHGFTWLTNYTWSHCLSDVDQFAASVNSPEYEQPNNRAADYGNCDFDVRHNMNTSFIVTSPIRGNGLAGRVLGQWVLSPILEMRSGLPINVLDGSDISQTGQNLDRPNYVAGCDPYLHNGNPLDYLNPGCFKAQATGTFGDLGRNVLIGPGVIEFDMALTRAFHLGERYILTPRVEAFNAINHPNFASPNTVLNTSTFGRITGSAVTAFNGATAISASAGDPRIFQFSMKLQF
jgi:Carboxypeptidase regulatory-like domain